MSKFTKEVVKALGFKSQDFVNDLLGGRDSLKKIEQVAANEYGHVTEDGWCCACGADIAFAESWLRETKPEIFAAPTN